MHRSNLLPSLLLLYKKWEIPSFTKPQCSALFNLILLYATAQLVSVWIHNGYLTLCYEQSLILLEPNCIKLPKADTRLRSALPIDKQAPLAKPRGKYLSVGVNETIACSRQDPTSSARSDKIRVLIGWSQLSTVALSHQRITRTHPSLHGYFMNFRVSRMQICPFKLVCQSRALAGTLQGLVLENKVVLKNVASVLLSEPAQLKHGAGSAFFSRDVKLNAPLLVSSPGTTLFLQEVMGSFNLHTCQRSWMKCCCWNRCVAWFQVVRREDHAFEQWWVKAEGREGKGERGEAVIHRENFHLINWLFTSHCTNQS